METALKIVWTYAIISFVAGATLMVLDVNSGHRLPVKEWVAWLYLPPLGVLAMTVAGFGMFAIWRG